MASSTLFNSNGSQAVRLPEAVAFPEDVRQVDILKIGRSRLILPKGFSAVRAPVKISWSSPGSGRASRLASRTMPKQARVANKVRNIDRQS
jgi:virulence-associated protein VagC